MVGAPLIDGVVYNQAGLPTCACDNFRNGLTTDHAGEEACAKNEVHGLSGVKTWCAVPSRPFIRHVDDGCASDLRRCVVSYIKPVFPACRCHSYAGGAVPGSAEDLCQKWDGTCYSRNYFGDKKIGGSEFFGCPEDTCVHACRLHTYPSTPATHVSTHSRESS